MMVKTIRSEAQRRGHNLKTPPNPGVWHHPGKTGKDGETTRAQTKYNGAKEFDKDFYEGVEDLFENYDTTLKNLVNK
ncbi:hypothetical protein [Salinicoccus sp. HZC-1]|uniref:hypothetical protein n=1 Tax=Salinicoccus sp. HZC-1 TaxID=3385497 RepID=UPI00398AA604